MLHRLIHSGRQVSITRLRGGWWSALGSVTTGSRGSQLDPVVKVPGLKQLAIAVAMVALANSAQLADQCSWRMRR